MIHGKSIYRRGMLAVLAAVTSIGVAQLSNATGTINKGDLNGDWVIVLAGNTGCGITSMHVTVTLSGGSGTYTATSNSTGCGTTVGDGSDTFTIKTLTGNGSGTVAMPCGSGCGWTFAIQVAPDRSTFTLVDVTDSLNTLTGVAVHQ